MNEWTFYEITKYERSYSTGMYIYFYWHYFNHFHECVMNNIFKEWGGSRFLETICHFRRNGNAVFTWIFPNDWCKLIKNGRGFQYKYTFGPLVKWLKIMNDTLPYPEWEIEYALIYMHVLWEFPSPIWRPHGLWSA